MRVVVTGAAGRLGSALVTALADAPFTGLTGPIAWDRSDFDLDSPEGIGDRLDRDRPDVVIHAAAMTDVDGCARDPELARRRNGVATGILAAACAGRGIDLATMSTNEVFDGLRTNGRGYAPDDEPAPINAYGASKLDGERRARAAFDAGEGGRLAVVRTSWLYGSPGNDFPTKILAAGRRARAAGESLRVVADEFGSPTYAADVAEAISRLVEFDRVDGVHHVVNAGHVSRAGWARELFLRVGLAVTIDEVPQSAWSRPSTPPRWGVLEPTPGPDGEPLRPWTEALAADLPRLVGRQAGVR